MIGVQPPHNPLNLELENALTIDSQYPKPIVVNSLTHNDAGTATYPHAQLLTGGQAWSSMSAGDGVTTNESHAVSHRESPGWKRKASLPLDGWLGSMSMNSPSPAPPSASSAGLPPPDAPGPSNWQSTPLQSPNSQTSSQYQYHAEASSSSKSLHLRPHAPHPRSRSASKLRSQDGDAEQSKVSHSGSAHDSDPRFSRGVGVAGIRNEDTERERERTEGIEDRWSDSKVPARQRFSDGRLGILPPGLSLSKTIPTTSVLTYPYASCSMQKPTGNTQPSSSSETDRLERYGYVTGPHRYLPQPPCPLCNAVLVRGETG